MKVCWQPIKCIRCLALNPQVMRLDENNIEKKTFQVSISLILFCVTRCHVGSSLTGQDESWKFLTYRFVALRGGDCPLAHRAESQALSQLNKKWQAPTQTNFLPQLCKLGLCCLHPSAGAEEKPRCENGRERIKLVLDLIGKLSFGFAGFAPYARRGGIW